MNLRVLAIDHIALNITGQEQIFKIVPPHLTSVLINKIKLFSFYLQKNLWVSISIIIKDIVTPDPDFLS